MRRQLYMAVLLVCGLAGTALAAPSVTVDRLQAAPGEVVTVTVAGGPGTSEDCVVLSEASFPTALLRNNVGGASNTIQFVMPPPGLYVFRFYQNCANARLLATSPTVTVGLIPVIPPVIIPPPVVVIPSVVPPGPTVTVEPSQSVTVSVKNGSGDPKDWVGLFPVGAKANEYLPGQWFRLNGTKVTPTVGFTTATLTVQIPDVGCPCEVRFYSSDGAGHYTQLGKSCPITLTAAGP